jgi:hypothetical protein
MHGCPVALSDGHDLPGLVDQRIPGMADPHLVLEPKLLTKCLNHSPDDLHSPASQSFSELVLLRKTNAQA